MYLIFHICFYTCFIYVQSLRMTKIHRNISELCQLVCGNYIINIIAFVGFIVWKVQYLIINLRDADCNRSCIQSDIDKTKLKLDGEVKKQSWLGEVP